MIWNELIKLIRLEYIWTFAYYIYLGSFYLHVFKAQTFHILSNSNLPLVHSQLSQRCVCVTFCQLFRAIVDLKLLGRRESCKFFFCQEGKLQNKWSFFLDFLPQPRVIFIGFTCAPLILTFIHLSSCIFPSLWTCSKSVHFFMRGKTWIPYFSGLIPHPFHCPFEGYAQSYFLRTIC